MKKAQAKERESIQNFLDFLFFRTIIKKANLEFCISNRKIGSQRFLPRKKASALSLRAR
jgi:hypothetical protein